jgi:alkaline phosphatase
MNFVSEDEDTLLIVTADHETGGLQIMGNENNQTKIQWGTGSHTGTPVGVYAYGPGANLFSGLMDNTEIHNKILEVINFKELDSSSCSN